LMWRSSVTVEILNRSAASRFVSIDTSLVSLLIKLIQ
jgi:hypothetical protein